MAACVHLSLSPSLSLTISLLLQACSVKLTLFVAIGEFATDNACFSSGAVGGEEWLVDVVAQLADVARQAGQ